jgi:hypothetical protein
MELISVCLLGAAIFSMAAVGQIPKITNDTEFRVKLLSQISSETSQKGEKIVSQIVSPADYSSYFMEGQIQSVKRGKTKSTIRFSFDAIETPDHSARMRVRSEIEYLVNSQGKPDVDEEGNVIKKSNAPVAKAVILTGLGAGLGAALGGGEGAAIGAGAGAATALMLIQFEGTTGTKITFAPGSEFVMVVRK